jgi:hypothetical protein
MAWLGTSLITAGTRHVKVWRIDETGVASPTTTTRRQSDMSFFSNNMPKFENKTLQGRPCILGSLLDATYTTVVPVAADKAIVCSDKGDICLLDDSGGSQTFSKICSAGFGISSGRLGTHDYLHLASVSGGWCTLAVTDLLSKYETSLTFQNETIAPDLISEESQLVAIVSLRDHLVTVDSHHFISLLKLVEGKESKFEASLEQQLPAHGDAVLGVRSIPSGGDSTAAFYTWSVDGTVLFWDSDGKCSMRTEIALDQSDSNDDDRNELRSVYVLRQSESIAVGDKYGFFR